MVPAARVPLALCALVVSAASALCAAEPAAPSFTRDVAPFLKSYCTKCHGGNEPEAKLGLDRYRDSANIQKDIDLWEKVLRIVAARQMPPAEEPQPAPAELEALQRALAAEIERFDCSGERHPGRVTIRRLNRVEYNNTIRDLTGVDFRPAEDFPADDVGNGFDNMGDVLSIPPILLEKYLQAAEKVIDEVFARDELRARILVHKTANPEDDRRPAIRQNIAEFAERAFRRPVTEADNSRFYSLRQIARADLSESDSIKFVLTAILVSPQFLFRIEQDPGPNDANGIRALDDFEIATRLSYFLWSTMPDEMLFNLARRGELHKPDVLESQVRRMLHDAKSKALIENFAGQWLQLRDVAKITPDPERYPGFDEDLRQAMLRETQLFLEALIRDDRSVLELINADFTFVNERLARHYGIDGITGPEFQKVSLTGGRRGVLTHASILTLTSNPTRTSPVKRGKWILDNILGEPPPPPPPNVPELKADEELLGTLRERMEQHRSDEACAVCHRQMDALGFGLEHFDGIGAWRDRDGRFEIDASGVLPGGRTFEDAAELMQVLSDEKRDAFCRCLTERMLTYALGRGLVSYDRCTVKAIMSRLAADNYRISALVTGIVLSDPFLYRERVDE